MTLSDAGSLNRTDQEDTQNQLGLQTGPMHMGLTQWLAEGLKAGFFVSPKLQGVEPKPWQVLAIVLLISAVGIGLGRLQVQGAAVFDAQAWLSGWWMILLFIALAWCALPATAPRVASVAAACLVWMLAALPAELAYQTYTLARRMNSSNYQRPG